MDFRQVYYDIVDFFEDIDDDEKSQEAVKELLKWWNQYVAISSSPHASLIPALPSSRIFPNSPTAGTSKVGKAKSKLKQQRAARSALADVTIN